MRDYWVTVCDKCLRASCWHFDLPCADYRNAGTVRKLASELRTMNLESHSHYSRKTIRKECGVVEELDVD